ncbi:response regulator [Egbenema bharatensis]|uniref:response regulator n=1 Tax=Egbenema bharatensis TaxID=3463334 RepID=UPI003A8600B0
MTIPDVDPPQHPDIIADAELQKELRGLFAIDVQHYLQRYSQFAQALQPSAWAEDIQELYRCIHTIKGGAVTIAAETIVAVSTALEDVLSDLRYLHPAPSLSDGQLSQILLEAGELLSGTLELSSDELPIAPIEPTLNRIQVLHQHIRAQYLPTWNAQNQLHQEFAEQGLDLVVLDLEIALERTPDQGKVTDLLFNTAQQTISQLQTIGNDLKLAAGWADLLEQTTILLDCPYNQIWRSQWLRFFHALKDCAREGGQAVAFEFELLDVPENETESDTAIQGETNSITQTSDWHDSGTNHFNLLLSEPEQEGAIEPEYSSLENSLIEFSSALETDPLSAIGSFLDKLPAVDELIVAEPSIDPEFDAVEDLFQSTSVEGSEFLFARFHESESTPGSEFLSASIEASSNLPDFSNPNWLNAEAQPLRQQTSAPPQPTTPADSVQIPVTLQKLDQSAQHLVETLLASRIARGFYQTLQTQIMQLVTLAQEGSQYITSLRQLQDDYALLDDLRRTRKGPVPERYRQGYTTLNRLLETSLRLAELGAEAEKTAQQTAEGLLQLDTNLLKLQTTVEDSRRLPFQRLGFRARAILRDLITRFGKPAQLQIEGESIELDVSTLRHLEPALLHFIRNAYAHGLESPEVRLAQGKPEQGTIWIALQRRGNAFQLSIRDDGRGMNPEAICARAKSLGLRLTQTQTPSELLAVICQPGFSSETQVTEVAGRGVGMDVIAAQIDRLGGKLSLDTVPGQGTTFNLQVPVPHLLVSCLLLQAGNRTFALPTEEIKTTTLFDTLSIQATSDTPSEVPIAATWMVTDQSGSAPALDLLEYWQPHTAPRSLPDTAVCVAVTPTDSAQSLWLVADELLGQSNLLISPIPSPLIAPEGLIGVSLQANGTLIPVLNAATIADRVLKPRSVPSHLRTLSPALPKAEETVSAILIVDDAALIRRRIEASLTAYGYTTHTCSDGLEAWNWLQKHTPTLIITDIEMPNMDGFTLTDRCRQAEMKMPILVVSSRLSEEWFSEAKRLGATDYLTKGFSTVELINKVELLTQQSN